jgi:hypothetical protein
MPKGERVIHMSNEQLVAQHIEAISEVYIAYLKAETPFDKHKFAVGLAILVDCLAPYAQNLVAETLVEGGPAKLPPDPPTPKQTARIYQFKGKE